MPKVSQNELSIEVRDEIIDSFVRILAKIDTETSLRRFLNDLLTPTEKVMLAKRLMIAVLLQRGFGYRAICQALKVSGTTVLYIRRELVKSGEGYRLVFEKFFQQQSGRKGKGQKVASAIERFLSTIALPIPGSRPTMQRWRRAMRR